MLPAEDPAAVLSVYIAGMPKDADEAKVTAMLTEAKQAHTYVPIVSVRRLRDLQKTRAFTGHVFVECKDATKAAALAKVTLSLHPSPSPDPDPERGGGAGQGRERRREP